MSTYYYQAQIWGGGGIQDKRALKSLISHSLLRGLVMPSSNIIRSNKYYNWYKIPFYFS